MAPTRILFVQQVGYRGGSGTMLCNILSALEGGKFAPVVLCPSGDLVPELRARGAEVIIHPRPIPQFPHYTGLSYLITDPRFWRAVVALWREKGAWERVIRDTGAQLVQLNALTLAPIAPACRRAGAKVVCLIQETMVRGAVGARTRWLRHLLDTCMDAVVFISEQEKARAHCRAPIVEVIPNWVDLGSYVRQDAGQDARRALGLPDHARVVLLMGGFSELKGTHVAVEAMRRLPEDDPSVLCIAGYDRCRGAEDRPARGRARQAFSRHARFEASLRSAIESPDLRGRIRVVGMQADVVPLYAAADVVVFPATRPHQARPVLEAGALRRPAVVSRLAGAADLVLDGMSGLTFPAGDSAALAAVLRRLLLDPALQDRLAAGNYAVTSNRHNGAINGPRYARVLERVLEARPAHA